MKELWERVMLDESFQAACQRYANGNGSSEAIAKAAISAATWWLNVAKQSRVRNGDAEPDSKATD
jgi:hypothetical protein